MQNFFYDKTDKWKGRKVLIAIKKPPKNMSNKVGIRKQPVTATYVGALIFLVKISENYCEIVQTKSLVL